MVLDNGVQAGSRKLGTAVDLVFNYRGKAGIQGNMPPDSAAKGQGSQHCPNPFMHVPVPLIHVAVPL
jgi:hypothetical protein